MVFMRTRLSTFAMAAITMMSCSHEMKTFSGGDENITFVGRTDYSNASAPKQWAAGGYFTFGFEGDYCNVKVVTETPNGVNRNILEVVVDETYVTTLKFDSIVGADGNKVICDSNFFNIEIGSDAFPMNPSLSKHHVTICRDTETAMGYTQLQSVTAEKLFKWAPGEGLKIEFIGNSITCGAEADTTLKARDQYKWGDWHRAYEGYGPKTARALDAQWSLVSVSGIGLIRSCCDMGITMPDVYDKVILRDGKLDYDFSYQPDIICSCLGQNDGIQDSTAFCSAYVDFIKVVKEKNPQVKNIVLLSSPMDHGDLNEWLCRMIKAVADQLKADGIDNVSYFFYSKAWNAGGADHPSVSEHNEIADELSAYLKSLL